MNFKEWLNFKEMPMSLNLVGDNWSQPKGFDDRSTKMINSDKAKNKIVRRLKNIPYDFNVYFVQTKNRISTTKIPKSRMDYYYNQMGITPQQAPIVNNKINMFITSWELDPPTAWMIIHRFAHSNSELSDDVVDLLTNTGKQMSRRQTDYDIVSGFGTMKSALNHNLGAAYEPAHEIITQFIMTNKITFDPSRKTWATQNDANILKQLSSQLEQNIKTHLQKATNYIYFLF